MGERCVFFMEAHSQIYTYIRLYMCIYIIHTYMLLLLTQNINKWGFYMKPCKKHLETKMLVNNIRMIC